MSLVSIQQKENNTVEMEISVSPEQLQEAVERVYRRQVKHISIPGFRKGKAPRQMIENMYGKGVFLEDAIKDLHQSSYVDATKDLDVEIIGDVNSHVDDVSFETGLKFTVTAVTKPLMNIQEYKGLAAEKKVGKVAESEVDAEIDRMRERNARIVTVEGRAAQSGDNAVIDFEGFIDGVAFDGGKGEDHSLTLGSGTFIDTFEDQIVGHSVGDSFDVNVTFPEEYHAEELKGRPAVFKVVLKELKARELPELDDEFVRDVSEFDTLDELKNDIRTRQQEAYDKRAQEEMENNLVDQIVSGMTGDIPDLMFTTRVDDMVRDFEYRLSMQGMSKELYLQYTGMNEADFRKTFEEQARQQVKVRLAMEAVARMEDIQVTDEDIEAEYEKLAESYGTPVDQLKTILYRREVRSDIKATRALDLVRDSAVITEVAEETQEADAEPAKKKPRAKKAKTEDGEAAPKKPAARKTAAKKKEAAAKDEGAEKDGE